MSDNDSFHSTASSKNSGADSHKNDEEISAASSSDSSSTGAASTNGDDDDHDDSSKTDEQDPFHMLTEQEFDFLSDLEKKILEMRRESAVAANLEDAAFIDAKIEEMEEFIRESKKELGLPVDVEMKIRRKRTRKQGGTGEDNGDTGGVSEDEEDDGGGKPPAKRK